MDMLRNALHSPEAVEALRRHEERRAAARVREAENAKKAPARIAAAQAKRDRKKARNLVLIGA